MGSRTPSPFRGEGRGEGRSKSHYQAVGRLSRCRSRGVAWPNTRPCQGRERRFESGRDRHCKLLAQAARWRGGRVRLKATVSKTVIGASLSRVQIPTSPPSRPFRTFGPNRALPRPALGTYGPNGAHQSAAHLRLDDFRPAVDVPGGEAKQAESR